MDQRQAYRILRGRILSRHRKGGRGGGTKCPISQFLPDNEAMGAEDEPSSYAYLLLGERGVLLNVWMPLWKQRQPSHSGLDFVIIVSLHSRRDSEMIC